VIKPQKGPLMKTSQIRSFSVHQTSMMIAVVYFVISLFLVPFLLIPIFTSPSPSPATYLMVLIPIPYAILGYIFTAIGCLIYNWLASKIGGIQVTTEEIKTKTKRKK
jgi:hypothetical protein